jgi:hypothetical protein
VQTDEAVSDTQRNTCEILEYCDMSRQRLGKHISYATDESNNSAVGRGENQVSVLAPESPDMDVAQFNACVMCTATLDRDQVPNLSSSNGLRKACDPKTSIYARRLRHQIGGYDIVGQ